MVLRNKFLMIFCGFICLIVAEKGQCLPVNAVNIGPGVYHATVVGNYAGQLAGGLALNGIKDKIVAIEKQDEDEHDFSEGAALDDPSLYESVASKGDHLNEKYFPDDYGKDQKDHKAKEYAEEESQGAASSHYEDIEANDDFEDHDQYESAPKLQEAHENNIESDNHIPDNDDLYGQPVPGIDHGNGAYSYSTTYKFPKY